MKKTFKIFAVVLFAVFFTAQMVRPDRTNPSIDETETLESSTVVPETVAEIFVRSCSDCHTNKTKYPWYSHVTPFNFLLARHVDEGRAELNFSVWKTYETARKRRNLDEICEQAQEDLMPLPSYVLIHGDAKLSVEDKETLCGWTDAERAKLGRSP